MYDCLGIKVFPWKLCQSKNGVCDESPPKRWTVAETFAWRLMIVPVPVKQPWTIWINYPLESTKKWNITETHIKNTTKPVPILWIYFRRVQWHVFDSHCHLTWLFVLPRSPKGHCRSSGPMQVNNDASQDMILSANDSKAFIWQPCCHYLKGM